MEFVFDDPMPVIAEIVDAETGYEIAGCKTEMVTTSPLRCGSAPYLAAGTTTTVGLDVQHAEEWCAHESPKFSCRISPYAKRIIARYPLRRETDIYLDVQSEDTHPFEIRRARGSLETDTLDSLSVVADTLNRLRLRGVPFYRGARLSLLFQTSDGTRGANVEARLGATHDQPLRLPVKVSRLFYNDVSSYTNGMKLGIDVRSFIKAPMPPLDFFRNVQRLGDLAVEIKVVRRNGEPARGAEVWVESSSRVTDELGIARFSALAAGTHRVVVLGSGIVGMKRSIDLNSGDTTFLTTFMEPRGATLEVHVTDTKGLRLPFAEVVVTRAGIGSWIDLHEGTQRIDNFTDEHGTRLLRHLPPGKTSIEVKYGSQTKSVDVNVVDSSETQSLIVKLP